MKEISIEETEMVSGGVIPSFKPTDRTLIITRYYNGGNGCKEDDGCVFIPIPEPIYM